MKARAQGGICAAVRSPQPFTVAKQQGVQNGGYHPDRAWECRGMSDPRHPEQRAISHRRTNATRSHSRDPPHTHLCLQKQHGGSWGWDWTGATVRRDRAARWGEEEALEMDALDGRALDGTR